MTCSRIPPLKTWVVILDGGFSYMVQTIKTLTITWSPSYSIFFSWIFGSHLHFYSETLSSVICLECLSCLFSLMKSYSSFKEYYLLQKFFSVSYPSFFPNKIIPPALWFWYYFYSHTWNIILQLVCICHSPKLICKALEGRNYLIYPRTSTLLEQEVNMKSYTLSTFNVF